VGFRKYSEDDAKRIRFIKRSQDLGFTLKEIKGLFKLNSNPRGVCSDVRIQADAKLREIEKKIRDLKRMKKSLNDLSNACGDGKKALARCQILNCFEPGWKCE
jgi:MerR family mercuric resistance operon transcriptional regulator